MENMLKQTGKVFVSRQQGILAAAFLISIMMIVAKVFGLLRFRVFATYFSPAELDVYLASFRIPDFLFETIFAGAIATAFIPIYLKYQDDKEKLSFIISSLINAVLVFILAICVVLIVAMPFIVKLIVPGFSEEQMKDVVLYSRLLLMGQLPFFVAGYFLIGIGQANKVFLPSSLAPILYNISIILATITLAPTYHIFGPIVGVIIGAVIFFIVQFPVLLKSGYRYRLGIKTLQGVKEFAELVAPRTFTVAANQIDVFVDLSLASLIGGGMYTIFYLAQHLMLLPVTVIGYSYGQASLPFLFELYNQKKFEQFKTLITNAILNIFYIAIPLATIIILLRTPIIRLAFGGREFDWAATNLTALTASYFALSLPAHALYYFILRAFYAINDARTPFVVSACSILSNSLLSIVFVLILKLPVWSLALSFAITMSINVLVLLLFMKKKVGGFRLRTLFVQLFKIMAAAAIAGFLSYYLYRFVDGLVLETTTTYSVFVLLVIVSSAFALLYWYVTWLLGLQHIDVMSKIISLGSKYRKKITEISATPEP